MCKQLPKLFLLTLILALLLSMAAYAGVTGKVSGEVIDKESEEPVVGATVRVMGTNLATRTDDDGEFFIINIPVGKYDLAVTSVGYESILHKEVRVLVDLTTPVDFTLDRQTIELGQEVVVYATRPTIQQDLTESRVTFTAERLKSLPNIVSVQSVLTNYPGVVVEGGDLHIRGGRSGQVAYYYDGFSIQDPFFSTMGMRIMPSSLEELSLSSGGFSAEYGEAMSGIVNAVTREGSDVYHGGLKMYEGATHKYDVSTGDWGDLDFVDNRSVGFHLSGPIPGMNAKRFNFFTAGEYLANATSLPHNDRTTYTWSAKLTAQPTAQIKMNSNFSLYRQDGEIYNHRDVNGRSYDFNLDGLPNIERQSYLAGLTVNYNFNERMIWSVTASRFRTYTHSAPGQYMDTYWDEWAGYSEDVEGKYNGTIHEDNYLGYIDYDDPYQATGYTRGGDWNPTFSRRESIYNSFKTSLLAQWHKSHQAKAGFEIRRHDIDWDFKQFYNRNPYGEKYTSSPLIASAFVQDKMEFQDLIVNVGMRLDYRDSDISYNSTPLDSVSLYKQSDTKTRLSPRLGISFPVAKATVLHFNYGLYYQIPQFQYLYTNLQADVTTGRPLLGNPDLDPEQTVSYELGLDHMISDDFKVDITAFAKDVEDLVTTRELEKVDGVNSAVILDNGDYGTVKGFDLSFEKLKGNGYFSGSLAYGFLIATGNSSYAEEPYYTYLGSSEDSLAPVTEYPLDFDQRHTVTAVADLRIPGGWGGKFLGVPLPDAWGVNLVGHYGSGLPYSPTDAQGRRLGERNEGRLPATYTVDFRFNKDFSFNGGRYLTSFFVEVDNLFDRRNVLNVYSRTGRPDDDGQAFQGGLATNADLIAELDDLYDHNPQNFSTPRTVRFGMEINF